MGATIDPALDETFPAAGPCRAHYPGLSISP
jgi:hypothetical protein